MIERVVGIDLGCSAVKWTVLAREAAADGSGWAVAAAGAVPTSADRASIVALLVDVVRLADGPSRVSAVGVGVPGHVDRRSGVVRFLPNLPGDWAGFPLGDTLAAATSRPVTVLNDARAFCLAESRLGAARGHDDALFLTLGTGVGGGVVTGGRLLTGPDDRLGEIGHLTYDRSGPVCGCGSRGCLEMYTSGPALAAAAGRSTAAVAVELAGRGDQAAGAAVRTAGRAIGETIASLCAVLPAGLLVIGGGVAAGLPLLRPHIETALAERRGFIGPVEVVPARLGADAGAIGAALAAAEPADSDGGVRELDRARA